LHIRDLHPSCQEAIRPVIIAARLLGDMRMVAERSLHSWPIVLRRWLVRIALAAVAAFTLAAVAIATAIFLYVARVSEGLPSVDDLAEYLPATTSQPGENRVFVSIEAIPPRVIQAFVAAEDEDFYDHSGLRLSGRRRDGRVQGGSTITQQVAKSFRVDHRQHIERSIRELVLAWRLDKALSKDGILEIYLNEIYLGRRSYGVGAASLQYFGEALDELSLAEAAFLAALPRAPNNYHPVRNKDRAISRRNWVLDRMVVSGAITREQADAAKSEDLIALPS
jgi:penicillin-binding protein 1A